MTDNKLEERSKRRSVYLTIENVSFIVVMMATGALLRPSIPLSVNQLIGVVVVATLLWGIAEGRE